MEAAINRPLWGLQDRDQRSLRVYKLSENLLGEEALCSPVTMYADHVDNQDSRAVLKPKPD